MPNMRNVRFGFWSHVSPDEIDYFRLPVFDHFDGQPFHMWTRRQELDRLQLRQDFSGNLLRSVTSFEPSAPGGQGEHIRQMLIRLADDVFCHVEPQRLTVYASTRQIASEFAERLSIRYGIPEHDAAPSFFLLNARAGDIGVESVTISRPFVLNDEDLALHYGDGIIAFERRLIEALNSPNPGLSILRGEPGTGKTSFIRHLMAQLEATHRFYFLPIHACQYLAAPEMVEFWSRENRTTPQRKRVVVLEDAEDLLMSRGTDNRSKVSALLNISDGFLGEFLQLHLICSVNCPVDRLDPAITRAGRLVACREFKRINRNQALRIAKGKGLKLPGDQPDYSLGDIYACKPWIEEANSSRCIGFTVK